METLLFVDSCVRGELSRTRRLADCFMQQYLALHPDVTVQTRDLCNDRLQPQYMELLSRRDALWAAGKLDDSIFEAAHQFAQADTIVIAAPFWDLDFPAILKIYLERISMADITFGYGADGALVGLCRAKKLLLITTRGGYYEGGDMEMGARHLEALCRMYGIDRFQCIAAEGLDDPAQDPESRLAEAMERARTLAKEF